MGKQGMSTRVSPYSHLIADYIASQPKSWLVPLEPVSTAHSAPQGDWLIKRLLPGAGLTIVFGASNSGKTFFTLDMALALATNQRRWLGHRCVATGVVYSALEGNLAARISAWADEHGATQLQRATLAVYNGSLDLFAVNAEGIAQIADDI